MKTAAVVPINLLTSAKSRLADHLSETERSELVYWMARRVLSSLVKSGRVEQIAVVSPDPRVLSWAAEQNVHPLQQTGAAGLNAGLELGRSWARHLGAEALVVLLGDLPCISPEEVADFIDCGRRHPVVLAPDQRSQGTNGLLLHLSINMPFAFGAGSLGRHQLLAREQQVGAVLFAAPGLGFDVDSYAELSMLYEFGIWMPGDYDQPPVGARSNSMGDQHWQQ
ncbi:MAG: 2-phospho-L-lactate guanylyltransferase [Ktedonobacterales bacterium]